MNTLSSLLNWIGNTIGANPSTLTTTSKTVVGAINEVNAKCDIVYDGDINLDTTAQAGTTDGDLYAAITALSWESDVID